MLPQNIIFVGVFISLFCSVLYIKNIFYGSTKPNLISWFIWTLAPFIGVFFELKAGAGFSLLGTFMAGFIPLLVIIFSLWNKKAYWKIKKLDIICGVLSVLALILYVFTHSLGISILFAIISDCLAGIPTIIKSWKFPESETSAIYLASILNNILALLIIKDWTFSIYSFSMYLIILNTVISFSIYHNKILKRKVVSL
jgi:hypothetical protein